LDHSQRPLKKYPNAINIGFQFVQYLKHHPDLTYDDLSVMYGVTKARVCQMVALYNRLPAQITDYLMKTDDPVVLKHFTERRLRPLTLLTSDDEKILKFFEIKEALAIENTSQKRNVSASRNYSAKITAKAP